ncbi:MAG: hypothetical protein ACFFD2_11260 [Promethearchaeota archaeon]
MTNSEGEIQGSSVLYKNKVMPKQKKYRLAKSICKNEIEDFIKTLVSKFKDSLVQILDKEENLYKILVEGKSLEDPSCIIKINLQAIDKNSTEINLDFDFKLYYKKVFKTGLIGILVAFAVITVSVGMLNVQNLLSLGYLLGGVGLFGVSCLILGIFIWNKSLTFHTSTLEALYQRLDSREQELIDKALQEFREKQLKEKLKEKMDTCYKCGAPIPSLRQAGEVSCGTCNELLLTCFVCLLNINHKEQVIFCPHCNSPAHHNHLREWLKIKNYCPRCKQKISEGDFKKPD